ncbi:MBL fold metallo-hydrolase [Acidaminobacter sp. JC074]|uniref:MBL fold metallo-hydrolase n=1 Tax=Acidaminobacter sp. JC074 TaxID=2530199 RepID=UPI001F100EB8|nr:MBL fold metallo-hydrolase [Acidaminobacter sp. JC074]MCH4890186.1 MBL fold metallo-hydrolase [Acidaminobacter sp. JC074]
MKIQLIRNATMRISYAGEVILTDPMLAEKGAYRGFMDRENLVNPTAELKTTLDEITKNVTSVLVSHTHIPAKGAGGPSDHFDQVAVSKLKKDLPILTQPSDVKGLENAGFVNVHAIEESLDYKEITVKRFIGRHADIDALLPLVGDSSAYMLKSQDEPSIFWTGDTLLTEKMKKYLLDEKPDLVIVHAGGAELPIDAEGNMSQLVMHADDTIEIAKLLPDAKIIAVHMESLDHCPVTRQELRMKAEKNQVLNIIIPEDGEIVCL